MSRERWGRKWLSVDVAVSGATRLQPRHDQVKRRLHPSSFRPLHWKAISCLYVTSCVCLCRRDTTLAITMNVFRILGDVSHTISKCILIWAIHRNKSAEGWFDTPGLDAC